MLASDQEREAAVLRLRAAHLEGRIDTAELDRRVGLAHAAQTRAELDELAVDLPERRPAPVALTSSVPRVPGRRHFSESKLLRASVDEVRERILLQLVPQLERMGFYVHRQEGDTIELGNRRTTGTRMTVRVREAEAGGTLVLAHGNAPLRARRLFATLD